MPKYNNETIEKIDLEIRRVMVREPGVSGRRIARLLKYDKDFIIKRKRKIDRRNRENISRSTIEKDLAELENIFQAMALDLYEIITSGDSEKTRIMAFNALWKARRELIDNKMDAGIFERQLGTLKTEHELTPEQSKLLDQAIEYGFGLRKNKKDIGKPEGEEGSGKS